ncbi:polymerase [Labrys miyagiensis]
MLKSSTVNLLAYTAQFGGGFSATLSIEDGRDHRETSFSSIQGGQQVPDVVGQLRWDQDWGSLAVQAAAHQFRTADDLTDADGNALSNGNKWGYAVGATGLVKLPFIDGGHFIVEGQYANGATHYLGAGNTQYGAQDYYYNANDRFNAGKGWSIVAEFGGNITPVLNANLVGSYINTTYDNYVENGINFGVEEFSIAGNLAYTIVKGLTISGEVSYTREKLKNLADTSAETTTFSDQKENIWQAGIRIKRVF